MIITVVLGREAFDAAIHAAQDVGISSGHRVGMGAPADGTLSGWVEEAWESVSSAFNRIYLFGMEGAADAVEKAKKNIDVVLGQAGKRASEVVVRLKTMISEYVSKLIEGALQSVRSKIVVGGQEMSLIEVRLSQKVVIGGSLEASLTKACELTSSSEFSVDANYQIK